MTQKIVIAKHGYDALTETSPNNLVFSSDYPTLKYYVSGTTSLTTGSGGSGSYEATVTHNLGYIPYFESYFTVVGLINWQRMGWNFGDAFSYIGVYVYATTTGIILRVERSGGAVKNTTFTFAYKIYRNSLAI